MIGVMDSFATEPDTNFSASVRFGEFHAEPSDALLFPFFCQLIGIAALYFVSRLFHELPYTVLIFALGALMGFILRVTTSTNLLALSLLQWIGINSELILVAFLPGLLFGDAAKINFHLFVRGIPQILLLAFPMVLLGTILIGLVGFYILPYGWSWYFALVFGAILSATDPVSVSSLLKEVGAPPSLRMLVSGESLFNDGSSIVFFSIFSNMALFGLGIEGLGQNLTVAKGFAMFFRMSLGGLAIGLGFAICLIAVLYRLNRKLSTSDTVLQVSATIAFAYLTFYTAEIVAKTSGVVALVVLGIATQAFGSSFFNDPVYVAHVWHVIEHMLNTLIFILAGMVWGGSLGDVVARKIVIGWRDVGYMLLVYVLVYIIRGFCIALFYPLYSRFGLKTSWREAIFLTYGGLRGGVSITLALSFDNRVLENEDTSSDDQVKSYKLFILVGAVAFLSLLINASTSRFLLKFLGLTGSSNARLEVLNLIQNGIRAHLIDDFVHLLSDEKITDAVDFQIISNHVERLRSLSREELLEAVEKNKASVTPALYQKPRVSSILSCLPSRDGALSADSERKSSDDETPEHAPSSAPKSLEMTDEEDSRSQGTAPQEDSDSATNLRKNYFLDGRRSSSLFRYSSFKRAPSLDRAHSTQSIAPRHGGSNLEFSGDISAYEKVKSFAIARIRSNRFLDASKVSLEDGVNAARAIELREIFIELLRDFYSERIQKGGIPEREFVAYALLQSLDFSSDSIAEGFPLNDWKSVTDMLSGWANSIQTLFSVSTYIFGGWKKYKHMRDVKNQRDKVTAALSFIDAHCYAESEFKLEVGMTGDRLNAEEELVIDESMEQRLLARYVLDNTDASIHKFVINHLVCRLLLYKEARYILQLNNSGVLKEREAQLLIDPITSQIRNVTRCVPDSCRY